jgi:ankyrin repeat protein
MDDDFSLDILYDDRYVPDELYKLVQHGSCSQLDIRLNELSNSMKYLTALRWYGEEQLSLLMVAALNGYDDIVRVLLTHCNPIHQVELKGQINISGVEEGRINGATALYCACYRGHFTVAKTLIELGTANVNQDTYEYLSYPLFIHATIMNRRDIVQFLLENKYADVNETKSSDRDECTAIIWAAFRGHTFLVEYLIANGADVNYSCENENLTASTALACAAIRGHIDSVRVLYNAGADINIKNRSGDTLLTTAVQHKYYSIINFLLEKSINTIEDVELAACSSFKISSSIERMQEVLELLKLALQQRELLCIPKVCVQSMDIYDYKQECQTVDELDGIKNDPDRIFIETLLIRERIGLSRNDINILKPLHDYGDRLAHRNEFDKCINVWIHMFYIYQQMKISTMLHHFVWVFCRMLTANQIIPVERFLQVCRLIFEPSQMEDRGLTLCNALLLVIIASKVNHSFILLSF